LRGGTGVALGNGRRRARGAVPCLWLSKLDHPAGRRNSLISARGVPAIKPAVSVSARRQAHIPALAADIDARTNLSGAVANLDLAIPDEKQMSATSRSMRRQLLR